MKKRAQIADAAAMKGREERESCFPDFIHTEDKNNAEK